MPNRPIEIRTHDHLREADRENSRNKDFFKEGMDLVLAATIANWGEDDYCPYLKVWNEGAVWCARMDKVNPRLFSKPWYEGATAREAVLAVQEAFPRYALQGLANRRRDVAPLITRINQAAGFINRTQGCAQWEEPIERVRQYATAFPRGWRMSAAWHLFSSESGGTKVLGSFNLHVGPSGVSLGVNAHGPRTSDQFKATEDRMASIRRTAKKIEKLFPKAV